MPEPAESSHSEIQRPTDILIGEHPVRIKELTPVPPDIAQLAADSRTVYGTLLTSMPNDQFEKSIRLHLEYYFWQCSSNWLQKKDKLSEKYVLFLGAAKSEPTRSIDIYNFGDLLSAHQIEEIRDSFLLYISYFGIDSIGIDSLLIDNQDRQPNAKVTHLSAEDYESEKIKRGGSFLMRGAEDPAARAITLYPIITHGKGSIPYDGAISLSALSGTIIHELAHCDPGFRNLNQNQFEKLVGWKFQNGRFEYIGRPERRFPTAYAKVQSDDHLAESIVAMLSGAEIETDVEKFIAKRRRSSNSLTASTIKSDDAHFPKPPEEIGFYYRDLYVSNFKAINDPIKK